jgi:hypothetical protein
VVDICKKPVTLIPLNLAMILAGWVNLTVPADAEKVPDSDPAAIVVWAGTVRFPLFVDSATATAPPAVGAPVLSVTVHVVVEFDATLEGLHASEDGIR